jgi:hypothetical protein
MKTFFSRKIAAMMVAVGFGAFALTGCEQRIVSPDDEFAGNGHNNGSVSILTESEYQLQFTVLLDSLQLTADQLAAIDLLKTQKQACSDSARVDFNRSRSEWAKGYEAERKAVMDSLRAGVITRDSSQKLMFEIAKRQSNDTLDKASRDSMKVALKTCNDAYYAGIYALLTDEQKVVWDAWMELHKSDGVKEDDDKDDGNGKRKDDEKRRDGEKRERQQDRKKD